MMYENDLRKNCEYIDSLNIEKIKEYEKLTGIAATSVSEMEKAYENRKRAEQEITESLNACHGELRVMRRKKKFWKGTAIVGIPLGISLGLIAPILIKL